MYLFKKFESNLAFFSKDKEWKHLGVYADRGDKICRPPPPPPPPPTPLKMGET